MDTIKHKLLINNIFIRARTILQQLSIQFILCIFLVPGQDVFAQAKVRLGIEELADSKFDLLKGKRVGLITNPTGVDGNLRSTIDILYHVPGVKLTALFSPEHGVRGDYAAGVRVDSLTDPVTGLPVFSLYGRNRKPSASMLRNVDILVYDIQDIGARSYTYISTMGLAMEAAAENDKEFMVLDRPNPLGGERVEGPVTEPGFISFVGQFPIPYLYGLTCGELALMLNGEKMLKQGVQCKLTVVPMEGWKRSMQFDETGLLWVPASPHIPRLNSASFYAASGIAGELNPNMIGVGYTLPFEIFAMPWIDAERLCTAMSQFNLEGVQFRPIHFKPFYMPLKDTVMHGVQVYITDPRKAKLTEIQFYFLEAAHRLYPARDFFAMSSDRLDMFDKVCGSDQVRKTFAKTFTFESIRSFWNKDAASFRAKSSRYYLYR
jgi:uncharacterized protein YbbC (DUF1343 family)